MLLDRVDGGGLQRYVVKSVPARRPGSFVAIALFRKV
jgi:hypothetical protein